MRDVAEQAALAGDKPFEALGHLVEGAAELADLIHAVGVHARGQVAVAEACDGGCDGGGWVR